MIQRVSLVAAIATLLAAAPASAKFCSGKVLGVSGDPGGTIIVNLEGPGWGRLCNVNTAMAYNGGSISPDMCKVWFTGLMTAKSTGRPVTIGVIFPSGTTEPACSALNWNWGVPDPYPYWMNFEP